MTILYIDVETYSTIDLRKANAYRYATDPEFQILMAAWAVDDGPVQIALNNREIDAIPGLFDPEVEKVAHNAPFERICFSEYLRQTDALVEGYLDPAEWTCTMALAGEWGYPRSLGKLAVALGAEEKDEAGTRLINIFSKPNRKGERTLPRDKPADWEEFIAYCVQDVATLRDVHQRLGGWPTEMERRVYLADQAINDRGILVDTELAECAIEAAEANKESQTREVIELTGVENPGSNPQMLAWFASQDFKMPNMQAATVTEKLEAEDTPPAVRRVLELRQELALVAAKKYTAALERVNADGRLRGSFQFFGAHTGRWAGRGVQLQNMPSATMETETDTHAAILDLKLGNGANAHDLKALVRAMFTGPFTVVDYAAIEARVIAWLAGEEWALQAFRDGRDIYVETGQRMGGMSRKEGKVAVLALGYNGGTGSLRAMGAEGTDEHLQILVNQWRRANPAIVNLWREMEDAFRHGGTVGSFMSVEKDGADRHVRLPSGRAMVYHDLRGRWVEKWGKRVQVVSFADANGGRTDTYGGRLTENVTQAVARDILAEALVRLNDEGHDVVAHVHDEVIVQGGTVEEITKVMTVQPDWAEGLPISAAGFQCVRYRKD